jgi:hypothetical protein
MALRTYHPGREALFEQMATPGVTLVEPLRIKPVQAMHGERELLAAAPHDEMEVRAEEAPGDQLQIETLGCLLEQERESSAIEVVHEYRDAAGAAARDVIDAVWKITAWSAGHG